MREVSGDAYLAEKAIRTECGSEVGTQDFNGYLALMSYILSKIDGSHTTATEFSLDLVAVGQGGFQVFEAVGHRELRWVKQRKLERDIDLHFGDPLGILNASSRRIRLSSSLAKPIRDHLIRQLSLGREYQPVQRIEHVP